MRGDRASIGRRADAAACFAVGVALAVAGALGGQALDAQRGAASAAVTRAQPRPAPAPARPPAPNVEEVAFPEAAAFPVSRYASAAASDAAPGARLGSFRFTRYYVVDETRFAAASSTDAVTIYDDRRCTEIASLSRAFVRELDMEGTGRLRDGRTINVSKQSCGCGRSPCYRTMGGDARWGVGARGEPLEPYRTVAVDPDVIPLGTRLYIPELDGLTMPGPAPWGGFVHDGCVVAIDVGGRIRGRDVDFFVGRYVHMKAFDARLPIARVTVYRGDDRCQPRG